MPHMLFNLQNNHVSYARIKKIHTKKQWISCVHTHFTDKEIRIQAHVSGNNHQDGERTQTQEKWLNTCQNELSYIMKG